MRPELKVGVTLSVLFHSAVLAFAGWGLAHSAQYGMELGSGGLELTLVAAPPRGDSRAHIEPEALPPTRGEVLFPEPAAPPKPAEPASVTGDGTSPVPGLSPTAFYSFGGGQSRAASAAFKNPAPPYPETARRLGQEGLVVLRVAIDKSGRPARVAIHRSSGYPLLDDSAQATVQRWKFVPARLAGLPVDSMENLKVRFLLNENEQAS